MKTICTFILFTTIVFSLKAQPLLNGGLEQGYSYWTYYSQAGDQIVGTASFFADANITPAVYPHSGNNMVRLGGFGYNQNYIAQNVALPNANPVKLELYYQTRSASTSECSGIWVGSKVNVYIGTNSIYETYLCQYNDVLSWTYGYFDLTAVAGQTVSIILSAEAANSVWSYIYYDDISVTPTSSGLENSSILQATELEQNFPNPFSDNTIIKYTVNKTDNVSLTIFDQTGRKIVTIFDEQKAPGDYTTSICGLNLDAGTYYYTLTSSNNTVSRTMVVIK